MINPYSSALSMDNPSTTTSSSGPNALITTLCNSIQALGRGFDVTSDIRLLYCKGAPGSRPVILDEENTRDLVVSDGVIIPNVSVDIEASRGKRTTESIPVCGFHEVIFVFLLAVYCLKIIVWVCLNSLILILYCGLVLKSLPGCDFFFHFLCSIGLDGTLFYFFG